MYTLKYRKLKYLSSCINLLLTIQQYNLIAFKVEQKAITAPYSPQPDTLLLLQKHTASAIIRKPKAMLASQIPTNMFII